MPLLADPPERPRVDGGYLDLLDGADVPSTGAVQSLWLSDIGSLLYDHVQAFVRNVVARAGDPVSTLDLDKGDRALDVGCGPGNVTAALGKAVGLDGLALGVDVSKAMLERAVAAEAGPNVGFLRASAAKLPLRDATVDAVTCFFVLQLLPDPVQVIDEITRVLAPGGHVVISIPTARGGFFDPVSRIVEQVSGVRTFPSAELPAALSGNGFVDVRAPRFGPVQLISARLS
jgi:SAM-dependent methyltransferase